MDASGAVYVTGNAGSVDFPTSAGAFDPTANADGDAFVAKFDPVGNLVYATYLGGSRGDGGTGIAVDSTGSAYVVGITYSPDFPATAGAFDTTMNGGDIFVAKLHPSGSALEYSTFLGGQGSAAQSLNGFNNDIAVDAVGSAYVTGLTDPPDFPTTPGAFDTTPKSGFVAKLNPAGSALEYSTFLGGTGGTVPLALAIDGSGSAYVTGFTAAFDFPTTPGAFDRTRSGPLDAFVTKLNPAGSALEYSTLLGGFSDDQGNGIAVDSSGNAYITGASESVDLPTTPCAFDRTRGGFEDAFVAKLNPSGTALVYSTYLGGAALGFESGYGIAVDASGSVAVAGATRAADFPVTPDAFDATVGGVLDGFVAKLNPSGLVTYATFLGGSADDLIVDIAFDVLGGAYLVGGTSSSDFPTTLGAFDLALGGPRDAFVTKMTLPAESFAPVPATLQLAPPSGTRPVGTTHTVTAIVADGGGNPSPGITVRFTVTGATTVSGSCVTGPDGQCAFTYQGPALPGANAISAFADTDGNGVRDSCREPSGTASVTWVAVAPAIVTLTPPDDINPVSTEHCVTATVLNVLGNPVSGVTVRFTVSGASTVSAVFVSNASGRATLCYTGPDLPGADGITAHADTDGDGVVNGGEPVGGATKTWVVPEATPGQVTGGGLAPAATGSDPIAFGFTAKSGEGGLKGHCDVIDRASDVQIKCLDVTALVRDETRVTLFGNATINGTSTTYRIDVDDLAEAGAGHDTFRIVTATGYKAGGILAAGNVQAK
jgi:hypothetical protein